MSSVGEVERETGVPEIPEIDWASSPPGSCVALLGRDDVVVSRAISTVSLHQDMDVFAQRRECLGLGNLMGIRLDSLQRAAGTLLVAIRGVAVGVVCPQRIGYEEKMPSDWRLREPGFVTNEWALLSSRSLSTVATSIGFIDVHGRGSPLGSPTPILGHGLLTRALPSTESMTDMVVQVEQEEEDHPTSQLIILAGTDEGAVSTHETEVPPEPPDGPTSVNPCNATNGDPLWHPPMRGLMETGSVNEVMQSSGASGETSAKVSAVVAANNGPDEDTGSVNEVMQSSGAEVGS